MFDDLTIDGFTRNNHLLKIYKNKIIHCNDINILISKEDLLCIIDYCYLLKDKCYKNFCIPEFVDTRFMQRGVKYGECVSLENLYKCKKCNSHLFLDVYHYNFCPVCGCKFISKNDKKD